MNRKLILPIGLLLLLSCQSPKIHKLQWLQGKWENKSEEGVLSEVWEMQNDSVYKGLGCMISNKGDTLFSERVSLEQHGNDLFYVPTVRDQNKDKPVSFKLISETGGEFVFENKEHDFPQRVIYKNPHPDTLYARIEGNDKEEFRKEEFRMVKKK